VDDDTKLTLHGLKQHYCRLEESQKNRKLFELLDQLEFNQVWVVLGFGFFFACIRLTCVFLGADCHLRQEHLALQGAEAAAERAELSGR
jgi:hypothetical protein